VETVFRTYLRAVADGDFATACALNAPETNQRLLDELARRGTPRAAGRHRDLYAGSASLARTIATRCRRAPDVGGFATVK
jgi:hypothetical protein